MRWIVVLVCVSFALGCASGNLVEERERYWENEAAVFFSKERQFDEVHQWLRGNSIYYTFDSADIIGGQWTVGLERVDGDGFVCEFWLLRLRVSIDTSEHISNYEISKEGMCL